MTEQVEPICQAIRTCLENARRTLSLEIRNYPSPIAACDVQFNYLLERRSALVHELKRLDALCGPAARADRIGDFVRTSPWIEPEVKNDVLRN